MEATSALRPLARSLRGHCARAPGDGLLSRRRNPSRPFKHIHEGAARLQRPRNYRISARVCMRRKTLCVTVRRCDAPTLCVTSLLNPVSSSVQRRCISSTADSPSRSDGRRPPSVQRHMIRCEAGLEGSVAAPDATQDHHRGQRSTQSHRKLSECSQGGTPSARRSSALAVPRRASGRQSLTAGGLLLWMDMCFGSGLGSGGVSRRPTRHYPGERC